MDVLLKQDIDKLGRRGQVVKVNPGYARNYLFPNDMALVPTGENLRKIEAEKERYVQEEMKRVEELKVLAQKLQGISVTIETKASPEGHLYGSVTATIVRDALTKIGYELETRTILLDEPLKELGVFSVPLRFHADVTAEIKVWIVEEGSAAPKV